MRLGAAVGVGGRVDGAPASCLGACFSGRHPEAGHRGRPDGGRGGRGRGEEAVAFPSRLGYLHLR